MRNHDNDNEFNLAAQCCPDFTGNEKTLLGDIAMNFRNVGINARMTLMGSVNTPVVKFFSYGQQEDLYLFVTRHIRNNIVTYEVSPKANICESYINFADVLISCRQHIERLSPKLAEVIPFALHQK